MIQAFHRALQISACVSEIQSTKQIHTDMVIFCPGASGPDLVCTGTRRNKVYHIRAPAAYAAREEALRTLRQYNPLSRIVLQPYLGAVVVVCIRSIWLSAAEAKYPPR